MWGEQWVCDCTWSNITLREKCRNCGAPRRPDHRFEGHGEIMENVERQNREDAEVERLSKIIHAKRLEIESQVDLSHWSKYKTQS